MWGWKATDEWSCCFTAGLLTSLIHASYRAYAIRMAHPEGASAFVATASYLVLQSCLATVVNQAACMLTLFCFAQNPSGTWLVVAPVPADLGTENAAA
jgi:hypothetical protein